VAIILIDVVRRSRRVVPRSRFDAGRSTFVVPGSGRRLRRVLFSFCVAALGLAAGACDRLSGDAASRMVNAVRDGAARLERSSSDTLVLSVAPRPWPGGCPDGYRVEWRADSERLPGLGVICTTGTRGFASIDYRAFVRIPRSLNVTKGKGEPAVIALRREHDGTIAVVALE
jgi:hypothetical protein